MPRTDGSITFSTSLDNRQLEKDLSKLSKEIEKAESAIQTQESKKSPLVQQAEELRVKMKEARAEVDRYRKEWMAGVVGADKNQSAAQTVLDQTENQYNKVVAQIEKIDEKLAPTYEKLDSMKEKAGGLAQKIAEAHENSSRMGQAVDVANEYLDKFSKRVKMLAKRVFVFTIIATALRAIKDWMWRAIQTNDEAVSALSKLKGALLTMAQPLVDVVIPAFTILVNVLTRVVAVIAQLMSYLFGKTVKESKKAASALNSEAKALDGIGESADDAAGSLAGFDEINTIQTEKKDSKATIEPDFSFDTDMTIEQMENLLGWIKAIGSALMAWKIGSKFSLGLKSTLGLALGIYSAFTFVKALTDAWANGVSWDNLLQMLLSLAGAALGFGIAFGAVGAGVALLVGGIAMVVTGFHDAFENGWNLQNLLTSISGIIATGIGIAVLTGSWIPLLIAGIAAVLLAFTVATGHGEELLSGLKKIFEGFVDFFTGIFTGDINKAVGGIEKIFYGLGDTVNAVIKGFRDTMLSFLNWLDNKTGGKLRGIIDFMKGLVNGLCDGAIKIVDSTVDGLTDIFSGLIVFLTGVFTGDWSKAWEGVKQIFKGVWNGIVGILESAINIIIDGLNWLISQMNKISFDVPDWVPGIGGKSVGVSIPKINQAKIPRLATGAVVPPNREFMAILGDNKKETEIVSPLSTMKQALLEAMMEAGGMNSGTVTVVVNLDGKEVARNTVKHVNNMTRQAGKPVLLY